MGRGDEAGVAVRLRPARGTAHGRYDTSPPREPAVATVRPEHEHRRSDLVPLVQDDRDPADTTSRRARHQELVLVLDGGVDPRLAVQHVTALGAQSDL